MCDPPIWKVVEKKRGDEYVVFSIQECWVEIFVSSLLGRKALFFPLEFWELNLSHITACLYFLHFGTFINIEDKQHICERMLHNFYSSYLFFLPLKYFAQYFIYTSPSKKFSWNLNGGNFIKSVRYI